MFRNRLREARRQVGMTQEQLAERVGVAKSTMAHYERGTREPDMGILAKIMAAVNVDANFLFQDEMELAASRDGEQSALCAEETSPGDGMCSGIDIDRSNSGEFSELAELYAKLPEESRSFIRMVILHEISHLIQREK